MARYHEPKELVSRWRRDGAAVCCRCGKDLDIIDPQIKRNTTYCLDCYRDRKNWERDRHRDAWCCRCGGPLYNDTHKTCSSCREKAREYQRARRRKACSV